MAPKTKLALENNSTYVTLSPQAGLCAKHCTCILHSSPGRELSPFTDEGMGWTTLHSLPRAVLLKPQECLVSLQLC